MSATALDVGQKAIYVVFSSTDCKIGKLIRVVTRFEYNHTSLCTDPELKTMYSFARYRKNAPFYGGFVKESCKRYFQNGRIAGIKVYRLPISSQRFEELEHCLDNMGENKDEYIYNLISAMCAPLNKRVKGKDSYTCVEFAVYMLSKYFDELYIDPDKYWSIEELQAELDKYLWYEGP